MKSAVTSLVCGLLAVLALPSTGCLEAGLPLALAEDDSKPSSAAALDLGSADWDALRDVLTSLGTGAGTDLSDLLPAGEHRRDQVAGALQWATVIPGLSDDQRTGVRLLTAWLQHDLETVQEIVLQELVNLLPANDESDESSDNESII